MVEEEISPIFFLCFNKSFTQEVQMDKDETMEKEWYSVTDSLLCKVILKH